MTMSSGANITSLAAAVAALQQLDAAALQRRWRTLVGGRVPPDLGRPLTLRILAYKLQAQRLGDLDKASVRELATLAKAARGPTDQVTSEIADAQARPIAAEAGSKRSTSVSMQRSGASPPRIARPGTLLVREHGGVLHRVTILNEGVTWNGRTYDSLSQVALAITGTRWNGPRFFGLRSPSKADGAASEGKAQAVRQAAAAQMKSGRAAAAQRMVP